MTVDAVVTLQNAGICTLCRLVLLRPPNFN